MKDIQKDKPYTSVNNQEEVTFKTVDDILAYYGSRHGTDYSVASEQSFDSQ